ncbi:MAG: serine hydrolase [Anaerolineales bacterium]|nr:serine hydrolase [Anaerolineales bacterium]
MNTKRLLSVSLVIGTGLAVIRSAFARVGSAKPVSKRTSYDEIDAYMEGEMRRLKIPGVSLTIVEGEKIVHSRGFGRARPGGEAPTPQTPFVLGSTTKSITALAVMQLVEAGKVELEAPVQRYLPWFRVADPKASAEMTVRHLVNQTSGLPMIAGMANLANLDDDPDAAERQARELATLKLPHPVGTAFEYSNLNYNLLGLIVEAAGGEAYADYIQRHIFDPLEMRHSFARLAHAKKDGLAVGHRYWFGQPVPITDLPLARGSQASGQLISCAEDMAHYLIALLNGGRYQGEQILSSAGIDELQRGVAEQRVVGTSVAKYGMGWFIAKIGRTKVVSHGGNVPDFWSYIAILPEQNKGIVLLANADPWGLPFMMVEVGDGAAALLAGEQPPAKHFAFIPWVMRALPLIPLLQIVGALTTLRLLRRWRQNPLRRPGSGRVWRQHILLPLIPNLSLVVVLAYLRSSGLLGFMHLYMPDLVWIARMSGGFAGIWALLRTALVLKAAGGKSSTGATHIAR